MKYRRVKDVIERIAGESGDLVRPVLPAAHPFAYRNKMAVPAGLVKEKRRSAATGREAMTSYRFPPVLSRKKKITACFNLPGGLWRSMGFPSMMKRHGKEACAMYWGAWVMAER